MVPVYVSLIPIGTTQGLHLGVGATIGLGELVASDPVVGTATVGYQYRSRTGLLVRPALSFLVASVSHELRQSENGPKQTSHVASQRNVRAVHTRAFIRRLISDGGCAARTPGSLANETARVLTGCERPVD